MRTSEDFHKLIMQIKANQRGMSSKRITHLFANNPKIKQVLNELFEKER